MIPKEARDTYEEILQKQNALGLAFYLHSLDMETEVMPREAIDYRSRQLSTLTGMSYDLSTSPRYLEAVEVLWAHREELEPAMRHEITEVKKEADDLQKVPKDELLAHTELLNRAYPAYVEAKTRSDYASFAPFLAEIFAYCRRYAGWVGTEGKAGYDVLLDRFEPGYTTAEYDRFFAAVKEGIVPLVEKIARVESPVPDFARRSYPIEGQKAFCAYLREVMCFDPARTAILESEHPFTTNNGQSDVRITNHYYENDLVSGIFSAIHEMGHGLYEMQVDPALEGRPTGGGASMAMHESQSRLMENMVGRSLAFWETHFPRLQEIFPEQLATVSARDFWRWVNRVACTPVRTEADELTYSLHVMVRYELEKAVMRDELDVADLPRVWNAKYKEYLGIDIASDREGCLQDMHWAGGDVGYFPTYALGSAYAAQIMAAMEREIDIDAAIREGSVRRIAEWLREHLHRWGASRYPRELLREATGEDFDPSYYVRYLTEKYSRIYGLG